MPKREAYDRQKRQTEKEGEDAQLLDVTVTIRTTKEKLKALRIATIEQDITINTVVNAFMDGYLLDRFSYNETNNEIEGT